MLCGYQLLTTVSLLYIYATSVFASVIYYVVPDDHTNSSANTLHHYMNNSRYFTSDVHLHFLLGKHLLHNGLIVNKVSNFLLSGDGTNSSTIYCNASATIAFHCSKNVSIENLTLKNCGYLYSAWKLLTKSFSSLVIFRCTNFTMQNSVLECDYKQCGLVAFNPMGYSILNNIKSGQLFFLFHSNASTSDVTTEISYYEQCECCTNDTGINIITYQHFYYKVILMLSYIKLITEKSIKIYFNIL